MIFGRVSGIFDVVVGVLNSCTRGQVSGGAGVGAHGGHVFLAD